MGFGVERVNTHSFIPAVASRISIYDLQEERQHP